MFDQYLWWCGLSVNALGTVAVIGFVAWKACDHWIRVSGTYGPLMKFCAHQLREKHKKLPG